MVLLIEIYLTTTQRFSSDDIYVNDTLYKRALLNEPSITKELSDIYYGITPPHNITIELSNSDGAITSLIAGEEIRGKSVVLKTYNTTSNDIGYGEDGYGGGGYGGNGTAFELRGKIVDYDLREKAEFRISIQDPDVFQTLLPKKVLENDDFPSFRTNAAFKPAIDLGKPYSLCFGYCKKVPLRYIYGDTTNDYYDYIIGLGPIESNNSNKATTVNVYRNKILVGNTEYYVHGGETTIQYTDTSFGMTAGSANPYIQDGVSYAFIRFKKEQRDFQGNLYELHIDLRGMKFGAVAERNFVNILKNILSTNWGLGLTVLHGSFIDGASYVSDLLCDGHISEQKRAADIRDELLYLCRGDLEEDENGAWIIKVDHYQDFDDGYFGYKDGYYENIMSIKKNGRTPAGDVIKNYTLKYGKNEWTNEYQYSNTRSVFSFGEDKVVETNFVRDHTTADRITCYYQKRFRESDKKLSLEVGMEGKNLTKGQVVRVNIPDPIYNHNNARFKVIRVEKQSIKFGVDLESYSSNIYTYTPGTLPSDANPDSMADYSNTSPLAPTAFIKTSQGTYQSSDGTTWAYYMVSASPPSENFARMLFGYKLASESTYTYVFGQQNGDQWNARIDGLTPGMTYDLIAVSENVFGLRSSGNPTLTGQIAPGDSTAPAQVTGIRGEGKYKTWHFEWTKNTEPDLKGYRVQIGNSDFSVIYFDIVVGGNTVDYTNNSLSYGTLYCRVKAVDFTGNESAAWSATASATTYKTQTVDINDSSVTYNKRQFIEEQSVSVYIAPPAVGATYTFTHNLGRKAIVTTWINILPNHISVYVYNNGLNSFQVCVYNASGSTINGTLYVNYW